jgi:hypothetical protein
VFVGTRQHQFSQELQLKLDTEKLKGVVGLYLDEQVNCTRKPMPTATSSMSARR